MSTSAHIGYIQTNGKVVVVHCRYDGYPSHTGQVLLNKVRSLRDVKSLISDGSIVILNDNGTPESDMDNDFVANNISLKAYLRDGELKSVDYVYLWSDIENVWLFMPTYANRRGYVPAKNYKELYTLNDDVIRNRPPTNSKVDILSVGVEVVKNGYDGVVIANEIDSNYGFVPKGSVIVRTRGGDSTVPVSDITLK